MLASQKLSSSVVERGFLSEFHRAMNQAVDFSSDVPHEKQWRHPTIQRYLSIQDSLGYRGNKVPRTLMAKAAWVTLQLRLVSLTFSFSFNNGARASGGQAGEGDLSKPGTWLRWLHTRL